MVMRTAFPSCCGASIIHGFGSDPSMAAEYEYEWTDTQWGPSRAVKRDPKTGLPIVKKTAKDEFLELIKGSSYPRNQASDHGYVAILTDKNASWFPVLREAGFHFCLQWNNTMHGLRPNYLFSLSRHTSKLVIPDFLSPPPGWEIEEEAKAA